LTVTGMKGVTSRKISSMICSGLLFNTKKPKNHEVRCESRHRAPGKFPRPVEDSMKGRHVEASLATQFRQDGVDFGWGNGVGDLFPTGLGTEGHDKGQNTSEARPTQKNFYINDWGKLETTDRQKNAGVKASAPATNEETEKQEKPPEVPLKTRGRTGMNDGPGERLT